MCACMLSCVRYFARLRKGVKCVLMSFYHEQLGKSRERWAGDVRMGSGE